MLNQLNELLSDVLIFDQFIYCFIGLSNNIKLPSRAFALTIYVIFVYL